MNPRQAMTGLVRGGWCGRRGFSQVGIVAGLLLVGLALVGSHKLAGLYAAAPGYRYLEAGWGEMFQEDGKPAATEKPADQAEGWSFLVLGNSHSKMGNPFGQLTTMLSARSGEGAVDFQAIRGAFLEQLVNVADDPALFRPQPPKFAILQGQKYSMSGQNEYPIGHAIHLVEQFNKRGCRVLLMPEWRVRGNTGEAQRATKIYERICDEAERAQPDVPVEIVPVGLVWDRVMDELPELDFYEPDGNHSNRLGGYLTALTFYCWLHDELPTSKVPGGLHAQQEQVQAIALAVCREYRAQRAAASAAGGKKND